MESPNLTPVVIAHRGASAFAPENTLAAFRLALEHGVDGIELDVQLTADNQIVVIHDRSLDRTTNATGQICDLTLEEIRKADAGNGEKVPTLEEVLDLVGDGAWINIELKGKSPKSSELPEKVLAMVKAHQLGKKIIYSSFFPNLLFKIRRIQPEAKVGPLMLPGLECKLMRTLVVPFLSPWSLHPHYSMATPRFMRQAKQKGQAVLCYTVNEPDEIRRLISLGVWGIITDNPPLAMQTREEAK